MSKKRTQRIDPWGALPETYTGLGNMFPKLS